jgi:hypothetical protein
MTPPELSNVGVWLDDLAPAGGAFAHALEWAGRLGLPLRAVAPEGAAAKKALEACAAACTRRGVPWEGAVGQGPLPLDVDRFLDRGGLCAFGDALPPRLKEELLRQSLGSARAWVLVCPRSWHPAARVLVLDRHGDPANDFLGTAAEACRALGVTPVVLTVARTEREARARQRRAEETFAAQGLPADCDYTVGWEVCSAVAAVARWRRCTHVFVHRRSPSPWWRRLRDDPLERLLGLSDRLTFLALPGAGRPASLPAELNPGSLTGKATKTC